MVEIIAYIALSIMIGAIVCLYGKRLYFPIIMFSVFISSLAFSIVNFGMTAKGLLIGSAAGIVLALLSRYIYKVGVFLLGAFGGSIIGMLLIGLLPESIGSFKWGILAFCAVVFGICAVKWCTLFIILGTALQGGAMVASGLSFLILNGDKLQQFVYADGAVSTITHLQEYISNQLVYQKPALMIAGIAVFTLTGFLFQAFQLGKRT